MGCGQGTFQSNTIITIMMFHTVQNTLTYTQASNDLRRHRTDLSNSNSFDALIPFRANMREGV